MKTQKVAYIRCAVCLKCMPHGGGCRYGGPFSGYLGDGITADELAERVKKGWETPNGRLGTAGLSDGTDKA